MNDGIADLKRVLSASGIYAAAALAQRGLAFVLLPIYTRFLDPAEYGKLELLTAFSSIAFGLLVFGLPSAILKCYHRDSVTVVDRARVLATACLIAAPVLFAGGFAFFAAAPHIAILVVGSESASGLVRIVIATGLLTSCSGLILASLRAEERAFAFSALTVSQFLLAVVFNVTLVVYFGWGLHGVLWGNLLSSALALPFALLAVRRSSEIGIAPALVRPLLRFGLLMVPVMLSGWIINLSDRYILRFFTGLSEVAIYGVGYKFGVIVELAAVWPFQLAWPAISFSISKREGHRTTYARALTYFTVVLVYLVVALSLSTRVLVPFIVGEGYREAYLVTPLVALAYALNGVQYCVSPGVHISGKTRYLTIISLVAAAVNLGLNLYLIPRYGMMGAAWSTAGAFLLIAVVTGMVAQHFYRVEYEYVRLAKLVLLGVAIYVLGDLVPLGTSVLAISGHLAIALLAFPLSLVAIGFLDERERDATWALLRQATSHISRWRRR